MGWLSVGTVSCCQGLARLACVEAAFPNTIWNGHLAVKGFPNYIYVKIVDSLITRGVVGREHLEKAFPHLFHVLL